MFWDPKRKAVVLSPNASAWIGEELVAHSAHLDALDPAGPNGVHLDVLERDEGLRKCAANVVKTRTRTGLGTLPHIVLHWLKSDLTRKREDARPNGPTQAFRELDRSWGDRDKEIAAKVAACPRDHEREAVRGEPHKAGYVNEWCPDGCGWQRRVELEAKG